MCYNNDLISDQSDCIAKFVIIRHFEEHSQPILEKNSIIVHLGGILVMLKKFKKSTLVWKSSETKLEYQQSYVQYEL